MWSPAKDGPEPPEAGGGNKQISQRTWDPTNDTLIWPSVSRMGRLHGSKLPGVHVVIRYSSYMKGRRPGPARGQARE